MSLGQPPAHIGYLDSVRGLAALAVVGSHYVNGYDLPCRNAFCDRLLTYSPLHIFWDGTAAVGLFFVLSGLVLSLKHFSDARPPDLSRFRLWPYCLGRMCRIWPPYLVALSVSALLYPHYQSLAGSLPASVPRHNDWLPSLWGRPAGWEVFFKDSFLLGMRMDMVYLPQAWTLSIELALSLLVPVGILLAARSSGWLVFFTLFAIYPLGVSAALFYFMLGILLAKHHAHLSVWLMAKPGVRRTALLLGLFLYTIGEPFGNMLTPDLVGCLSGLGAALLILHGFASAKMRGLLSCPPLRYIGKISYSLYLVHLAVLIYATPWLLAWLDLAAEWFVLAWWAGLLSSLCLSILLADFSYRLVEVPSIGLGRRLGQKR